MQRVSRLVRKTLSLENHIGAIWYFIHHYNASLLVWQPTKDILQLI
jgi:phage terminase large subunit GpA-like protein